MSPRRDNMIHNYKWTFYMALICLFINKMSFEEVLLNFPSDDSLISQGKPASQSSTNSPFVGSRAVDGNVNQDEHKYSCSETAYTTNNPWWQLDLESLHQIRSLSIYNRGDCCGERLGGFKVQVSSNSKGPFTKCAAGPATTTTGQIIHLKCVTVGRYVRITIPGSNKVLSLCEVKIYGVPSIDNQLISQNKIAKQSSTYSDNTSGYYVASRAVDGDKNRNAKEGSCSHTNKDSQPWWQIDLGDVYKISRVDIYNRLDCCSGRLKNFEVLISNDEKSFKSCFHYPGSAESIKLITATCVGEGRFVRIRLRDSNYLTLCEVEVFGNKPIKSADQCYRYGDKGYIFNKKARNFNDAISFCNSVGMRFTKIRDAAHNSWLAKVSSTIQKTVWWIGASDAAQEGKWIYPDNSPVTFTNWRSGQPDNKHGKEDCAAIGYIDIDKWNDGHCESTCGVICEWDNPDNSCIDFQ